MALLDMIGVASILPFMTVLTNPNSIETNIILKGLFEWLIVFGIKNHQDFIFLLGFFVFLLLIVSLFFKLLTNYALVRFVQMREFTIGKCLIEGYLHQPYEWFLSRNNVDLGKTILSEVQGLILNGMQPLFEVISKTIIAIVLIFLLIMVDVKIALTVGFGLAGTYFLFFYFLRKKVKKMGKKRLINNELRFMSVIEAFGAVKEVKVDSLEHFYINRFSKSAKIFAQTQASTKVITMMPRFILEMVAFGGILLLILYLISQTGNFNSAMPIIGLYVFAGYRLIPALQQIYASFTNLNFVSIALDKLYLDVKNFKPINYNQKKVSVNFNKDISLKNICYNYPNSSRAALRDINLTIPVKSTIGIIGKTGSGKTTLVDIILGLLKPQKGNLKVDDIIINNNNLNTWKNYIGYVPQQIFLSDDTIAANIGFGLDQEDIDQNSIEKAAKNSNIHNFIINELPEKYKTKVGERGIRLSGGQKQRIGIARALYYKPKLLILDEATSALDNKTEQSVMEAINKLREDITVLIIAHRLNTLKNCDKIIELENGTIKNEGTFEELVK
jgi:ABC-type bacteriocin/lantibiotic exporter with double-glycine peptidase domain